MSLHLFAEIKLSVCYLGGHLECWFLGFSCDTHRAGICGYMEDALQEMTIQAWAFWTSDDMRKDSLPSADVTKETLGGCGWQGLLGRSGTAPGHFAKGQVKSRSCVCLEGDFFFIIPKSWMGEWDPGLELRWLEWMEKGIAGTSFTDKHPIISMPSSPVSILSFQSIFPPIFFSLSGFWASFQPLCLDLLSLTLNLAGTALKGPKRKPKHTRSLNTIDTAICQAPRASGRDVLYAHLANWSTVGP